MRDPGWLEVEALDVMGDVKNPAAYQDRLLLLTPDVRCPRWRQQARQGIGCEPFLARSGRGLRAGVHDGHV